MNPTKRTRRAAGPTGAEAAVPAAPSNQPKAAGRRAAKEPKTYADTPAGTMEQAADGLQISLATYEKGIADIADADVQLAKIKVEVDDYLASIDPRDEKAVHVISAKQEIIRLLPGFKAREEARQDARGYALGLELDEVSRAILACADVEIGGTLDTVAAAIRPWFPPYVAPEDRLAGLPERTVDPARQVAGGSALFSNALHLPLVGPLNWRRPEGGRLHANEANVRSYDRALIERAGQLLGIYRAWQENGRSFLRHRLPDPAGPPANGAPPAETPAEAVASPSAAATLPEAENVS